MTEENKRPESVLIKLENGDMHADQIYPATQVDISVDDIDYEIGTSPEQHRIQIIKKDMIPILYKFLKQQIGNTKDIIAPHQDLMDKHGDMDIQGEILAKLEKLELSNNQKGKYAALDQFVQLCQNLATARKTVKVYQTNLDEISKQLKWMEENYDL